MGALNEREKTMGAKFPIARDIFERVAATFVATVLGLATADGVDLQNALSVDNWKTWGVAGVVAAFTLLKSIVATQIAKRGGQAASASLDPAVQLEPVPTH